MIEYREANVDDAYYIAYVNVHTWKSTYYDLIDNDFIDKRIKNILFRSEKLKAALSKDNNFIVATDGEVVVGYVTYGKSRNEKYKGGEIGALYLLKEYQGQGIGKNLFLEAISKLIDTGYTSMILNCLKGNKTLGFYKRMGGIVVDSRTEKLDTIVLEEDVIYYPELEKILSENKTHKI